jgi:hypothetical protein
MKNLLLAGILLFPAILPAAVTDGLVAQYKFDEASGTTATDNVRGAAGDGTLNNFPGTQWSAGQIGGCLNCDGANDWVNLVNPIADNAVAMSFSGWVWANSRPTWASIVKNWGNSLVGQYHFGLNASDGRLSNYLTNSSNVIDPVQFPTGSWQHVAFTYDGTTHRLYRNGAQVASLTTTTTLVRNSATTAFGVKTNNGGTAPDTGAAGYWNGKYDDFGFWNRALTAAELDEIYQGGLQGRSIGQALGPVISSFTANPPNVSSGQTTTLSWTVSNAVTLTLNGGSFSNQNVTGQTSIVTTPLTADTTFTLTATNPEGTNQSERLVGILGPIEEPVINEFLASSNTGILDAPAAQGGSREDWIEIRNPNTAYTLDLAGYKLTDDPSQLDKWTFPATNLAPGAFLVVFASEKDRRVPGQTLHTNFKLSENGEYLALVKPDGVTIVQEFAPAYPNQQSDITFSAAGYLATPTPGTANSALAGPVIQDVTENPPPPADADDVTVNATITAQGGATVTSATLFYRVMYSAEVSLPMTAGADNVFSAVIPAAASTPGQMIRWRVTATDSLSRTKKAPLYRDPTNSPEYFGTVVQDASFTTALPVVERFVAPGANIDTDPGPRCAIFLSGEFFDNCGIRIRGFTSRSWPKKSHKIEGNTGHRFRFKPDVPRVTEFDLNTTYTDKAYTRSILTSEMQRAAGMISPDIFAVHVRQNAAFYSVALFTENPDDEYLERHGIDPEGAYYKAPTNNLYETSSTFEKKSRLYESGKADLDALIAGIALTGTPLETYVFDNVDLPGMVNYIATTCITQNIDASDKNHFAWRDTNDTGEWVMQPWDLDLTFGPNALNTDTIVYNSPSASHPFIGARPHVLSTGKYNRFLEAIVNTPRSRDMVIRRIRSLMDQFMATNWFQNRIDQLVPVLQPDVTADHAKWLGSSHFGGAVPGPTALVTANNRIKNEYLTPRLTWLNGGGTVGIPAAHPAAPQINFGAYEQNPAGGNQDQEYIELINPNAFSVDVSGWTITGGITHTIKHGTVMLAGSSLYLSPKPSAFRARTTGPRGAQRLFVQGKYNGHLSNFSETLTLKNTAGTQIASLTTADNPSDLQRWLRITEVYYNPPGSGDETEFIELTNTSPATTLTLTGIKFTSGLTGEQPVTGLPVYFTFPAITLAPGAGTLVVRNQTAFLAAFPAITAGQIAGTFPAGTALDNGGETLKLDDVDGSTIDLISWDDVAPWPIAPDGDGASLHFVVNSALLPDGSDNTRWFAWTPTPTSISTDTDRDGHSDLLEFRAGTNPGDGASFLNPSITLNGGTVNGSFPGVAGRTYRVQSSPDLVNWTNVGSDLTPAADGVQNFTHTPPAGLRHYYRVELP